MRRRAIGKPGLRTSCAMALTLAAQAALADVNYGVLDLGIDDLGLGNQDWVLNGIEIRPAGSVVNQIQITGAASALADGGTDTFTGTGATPNSLVNEPA